MAIGLELQRQMLATEFPGSASAPTGNYIMFLANDPVVRSATIGTTANIPIDYSTAPAVASGKRYAVGTRLKVTSVAGSVLPALSTTLIYYVVSVTVVDANTDNIQIARIPSLTTDTTNAITFTAGGTVTFSDLTIAETVGSGDTAEYSEIFAMADAIRYEVDLSKDRPSWFVATANAATFGRPRDSLGAIQTVGSIRAINPRGKIGEINNDVLSVDVAFDGFILIKSGSATVGNTTGTVAWISQNAAAGETLQVGVTTTITLENSSIPEF